MAKFTVSLRLERAQISHVDIEIDKEDLKDAFEEIDRLVCQDLESLVSDPSAWEEEYDIVIESIDDEEGHLWLSVRDAREELGVSD
jgi:hypothetical protein